MSPAPQLVPAASADARGAMLLPGLDLREVAYPGQLALPRHEHARATLCFVFAGGLQEESDGRQLEFLPGTVVLRPPQHVHMSRFSDQGAHSLVIELEAERLAGLDMLPALDRPTQHRSPAAQWLARQLRAEMQRKDSIAPLAVEGLCLALLAEAARPQAPSRTSPPLQRCEAFLQEHFQRPIGLAEAAAAACLHPSHLARAFRAQHGCTVGDYLRRLRLQWAATEIARTRRPLGEIATAAGFYDQSHFTNCFRRYLGQTPASLRKADRNC